MRTAAPAAMLAVIALLTTACNAGSKPNAVQLNPQSVGSKDASVAAKYLKISPAPGTNDASPSSGITVNALQGAKLASVTVKTSGDTVHGSLNSAGTSWHNDWTLSTGQSYTVTAAGTDSDGHPVTSVSTFKTLSPSKTFHASIFEGANETYGVGMAIMLTFNHAITNKAAVEKALQGLGGKLEAIYYAYGDTDVIIIADIPDVTSAVALSLVVMFLIHVLQREDQARRGSVPCLVWRRSQYEVMVPSAEEERELLADFGARECRGNEAQLYLPRQKDTPPPGGTAACSHPRVIR